MKNKKTLVRTLMGLLILFISMLDSCKEHCEVCKRINPLTLQVIDTQTACRDYEIEHLESRGYSCN
jgi:hypothetical protein